MMQDKMNPPKPAADMPENIWVGKCKHYGINLYSTYSETEICTVKYTRSDLAARPVELTVEDLGNEVEDMMADISFMDDTRRHFADALAERLLKRFNIRIIP